jgi:hypothetical protein
MMLRLKCVPLGAPFPVVVTEAVVRFELDVVVVVVLLDVVDVGDVAVPVTADVTLVAALWTVFAAAVAADVVASGATAYAPATSVVEARMPAASSESTRSTRSTSAPLPICGAGREVLEIATSLT